MSEPVPSDGCQTIRDTLRDYITHSLNVSKSKLPINDDTRLLDSGVLDSLGVMKLLGFLEQQFHLRLDNIDDLPVHLESINTICALAQSTNEPPTT